MPGREAGSRLCLIPTAGGTTLFVLIVIELQESVGDHAAKKKL